jgi:small subunit ribosomal protein S2
VIFSSQGKNRLAIQECRKLGIHAICIVDTNCDPDLLPYSIPANDDSLVSIAFIFHYLANRAIAGHKKRFQVRSSEVSKKVSLTY